MLPPPPAVNVMADDPRLVPFRQYSGAKYKFLPSEPREMIPGQDQTCPLQPTARAPCLPGCHAAFPLHPTQPFRRFAATGRRASSLLSPLTPTCLHVSWRLPVTTHCHIHLRSTDPPARSSSPAAFDGYEFTQPLYSSFTNDKTFQPPRLPPRPQPRSRANAGPALRERARPSTTTGSRFEGRTGQHPSSAPNGPGNGGLGPMTPAMRPGTAAMGALRG